MRPLMGDRTVLQHAWKAAGSREAAGRVSPYLAATEAVISISNSM